MSLDRVQLRYRLASPVTALVVGLAAAVVLMFLPPRWAEKAKTAAASALHPARLAAGNVREHGKHGIAWLERHWETAEQLEEAENRCQALEQENRRLAAELELERSRGHAAPEDPAADQAERLLKTECVRARVLGQQARAFLQRQHLLDVGVKAGIQPDALVVEDFPPLVDRGRDAGLQAGQWVLNSGRVWGKIVQIGSATSIVRTITEPGYRDVVRLASPANDGGPLRWGPQGVLEGTGEPWARVCRVEATEPVAIGDLVYTATGQGLLPQPLLYGRVVRLARPVGASHWEIWMEPAVRPGEPDQVAVLRTELNPARIAAERKAAE